MDRDAFEARVFDVCLEQQVDEQHGRVGVFEPSPVQNVPVEHDERGFISHSEHHTPRVQILLGELRVLLWLLYLHC